MRWPRRAEEIYGALRRVVKPILEKISVATRTGTASLKPTYFSLVPNSLKKWCPRWLLLTPWRLAYYITKAMIDGYQNGQYVARKPSAWRCDGFTEVVFRRAAPPPIEEGSSESSRLCR